MYTCIANMLLCGHSNLTCSCKKVENDRDFESETTSLALLFASHMLDSPAVGD